ncbi:hypothetical protein ACWDTI_05490 [Gordonia sp. NPDC003424]
MVTTELTNRAHPDSGTRPDTPVRISAACGLLFSVCQIVVMAVMATVVLPHGGGPGTPAGERGAAVLDAITSYRVGNYVFIVSGMLILGFLGAVGARLEAVDRSHVLARVGVASGTLLALIWPLGGVLHDIALEVAAGGTDVRILGGWDAAAPFSLAFAALPRAAFVATIVVGLWRARSPRWLVWTGAAIIVPTLIGSATLVSASVFGILAVSTLCFDLWIGAVAWHWAFSSMPEMFVASDTMPVRGD